MFKKPDITAPRFVKDSKRVLTTDLFARFKEKYPQYKITYDQFKDTIINHSEKMWNDVIDNRDGIVLPEDIGTIFLGTTKIVKKNNVNIQASILANERILHRNWETDGHVGKIYFTSYLSRARTVDTGVWNFTGHRLFKRAVSKEYPKDWKKYSVILGLKGASKIYKDQKFKHRCKAREDVLLQTTYNEFNLD